MTASNTNWTEEHRQIAVDPRYTIEQAARLTGRSYSAVRHVRYKANLKAKSAPTSVPEDYKGTVRHDDEQLVTCYESPVPPTEPTYEDDRELADSEHWQKRFQILQGKYRRALAENSVVNQLVQEIRSVAPVSYDPAPPVASNRSEDHGTPQSAFLMLSDTHVGKVIDPNQTLGFGGYNFGLYLKRLKYLEESVISIKENHTTTHIEELVVAILGDMLDGALNHGVEAGQRSPLFNQYYGAAHATAQFLRNLSAHFPVIRIKTVVGNHCVDEKTEILTQRGWLKVHELLPGDSCLGSDSEGNGVWQPVNEVVRQARVDRMVSISNRRFNFRGTEHHRFYFRPVGCTGRLLEARWSDIAPLTSAHGIEIPTAVEAPGDGSGVPDRLIELTAAVLTDGCLSNDQVIVYQTPKKEAWVAEAFKKSGLEFSRRERSRKSPLQICGRPFLGGPTTTEISYRLTADSAREFREITGVLEKNVLPEWSARLTKAQFDRFFWALVAGDGTVRSEDSVVLYGKSREWLSQIQALCIRYGWTGSLAEYQPANDNPNPQHRLYLNRGRFVSVGANSVIQYEDGPREYVWCVRTDTENFFVRREGKAYLTGNTRWQTQRKMPTENRFSNLDMFYYALVQALVSDIKNIDFRLDAQPFSVFKVQGFVFHAAHGDHLRGGDQGLGIPSRAVAREISAKTQLYMKHGQQAPHYYVTGHLHREIVLPHTLGDYTVNGGFPGVDNYGLSENFSAVDPSQRFFFVHPKYGKTAEYGLSLKHADCMDKPTYTIPEGFACE